MNIQMAKKWPEMVVTRSFIKGHSFPITLYVRHSAIVAELVVGFGEQDINIFKRKADF